MSLDLDFLNNDNEDYSSYFLSSTGSHLDPNIFTDNINSDITTDKELLLYFLDNLESIDKQKLIDEGYDKMKIEYILNTIEERQQQQQKKKENLPVVVKETKKKNHMKTTSTGLSYFDENLIICPKNHKKNYCPYLLKCICYLIRKSFEEDTVTEKSIGEFFDNITITHAREECILETIPGKRKRNDKGENDRFHGKTNKEAKMMLIENIKKNLLLMINDKGDETERMYIVDMLLSRLCFDGDLNKHNIIQTMRILPNRTSLTRMNLNIIYPRFSSIVTEDKKFQEELIEMRCPIGDSDITATRKRHRKFVWL